MTLDEVFYTMGPLARNPEEEAIYRWFSRKIGEVLVKHHVEPTPLICLLLADVASHAVLVHTLERWISENVPGPEDADIRKRLAVRELAMDVSVKAHAALRKAIIDVRAFLEDAGTPIPTGPAGEILNLLSGRGRRLPAPPVVPPGPGSPLTGPRPDLQARLADETEGDSHDAEET